MDQNRLQPYEYLPFQDARRDIRIVELLPGQFDDSVRVLIHHAPLVQRPDVADTRMTVTELAKTLPSGWKVASNLERRYFFRNIKEKTTSWEHPDPRVDKATYDLPTRDESLDPQFEALSYVWGSEQRLHSLIIEGGLGRTQLPITENLMTALRHLRKPNESRRLWIDAVCINQDDPVELGSQVQRMGLIYKLAHRVIVWLGPQSDDSAHALAALDYIGSQIETDYDGRRWYMTPFAYESTWHKQNATLPYGQHTWDAILSVLLRPWFRRVWTVQEIQLGSRQPGPIFHCGMETIELAKFCRAVQCIDSKRELSTVILSPELTREVANAAALLEPMPGYCFRDLLRLGTVGRLCKDSRDIIYGIIGLLPKGFASKVKVDYRTTNTTSQVYKNAFVTHALHVERLELFSWCSIARKLPDAPSWVPNWNMEGPKRNYHKAQFAAGASRAHFNCIDDKLEFLEVVGVFCAVVSHVSEGLPEGLERQDAVDRVRKWQPGNLDTVTYGPTGEPLREAYACTLIENAVIQRFPASPFISRDKWVQQAGDEYLFSDGASSQGGWDVADSTRMEAAINRALGYCAGRTFIQTREGYIGLAPAETQLGDVIAVFLGCSNPLVLRPKDGTYSVIGDSFVYGLEDAIKILGPLPEPWRLIWKQASRFYRRHWFLNPQTGETTREDPRLEYLHNWSRVDREGDGNDPIEFDFFEHQGTGVVVNYDPRLEPAMLEKKGVHLERFILV